jgi:hypothetical protein
MTSDGSSQDDHSDGQALLREFGDANMVEKYMNTDVVDVRDRGIGTCMRLNNLVLHQVYLNEI